MAFSVAIAGASGNVGGELLRLAVVAGDDERRHADVAEAVALQPGGTAVGRVIGHVRLPKSSLSKYGSVHPSKDLRVFEAAHTFSSPLEAP